MAAEITYTDHGNLFLAAALNQLLWQKIVDKSDMRGMCVDLGLVNGSGSAASKVAQVQWDDAMAAANADEVTAPGNTDLGTDAATITVARQVLVRQVTDLYELIGGSRPAIEAFAVDMGNAALLRYTDMCSTLFTSITANINGTGRDLNVDDVSDAMYTLIQARVPGPYNACLAPIQLTDFLDSLRGEGGSAEYSPATEALVGLDPASVGYGKHGAWRGVNYWSLDSVPTDGGDRVGAMCGYGLCGYREGIPTSVLQYAGPGSYASVAPNGAPIFVEFERLSRQANTYVVGNYYVGVGILENARGVRLISSST